MIKFPKNDSQYRWTSHIKNKMLFYRISEQKIKTILKTPDRKEEGVAPSTLAAMKRNDTPKRKEEIWVMYATTEEGARITPRFGGPKKIMISAWRYPGKSKPGKQIPIPDDILEQLKKDWF